MMSPVRLSVGPVNGESVTVDRTNESWIGNFFGSMTDLILKTSLTKIKWYKNN